MEDASPSSTSSPQSPLPPHHHHHLSVLMAPPSSPPPHRSPQSQPLSSQPPSSSAPAKPSSRRIPPPCWSHEETVALIDSYRDKWYSLRRGNLRAAHWQEVADGVAARCPHSSPSKTAVQCRHKMEKLRKRYRAELQRAGSIPNHRFSSSWVHFKNMHSMERGPNTSSPYGTTVVVGSSNVVDGVRANAIGLDNIGDEDDDDEDDDDDDDHAADGEDDSGNRNQNGSSGGYLFHGYEPNRGFRNNREFTGFVGGSESSNGSDGGNGFKIRNPGVFGMNSGSGLRSNKTFGKFFAETETQKPNFSSGSRYASKVVGNGSGPGSASGSKPGLSKTRRGGDGAAMDLAEAVKSLGDEFLKVEKMKMDMVKEVEQKKMEMEVKRTEMILESQQRLVEAFVNGLVEKKRSKKRKVPENMSSPESFDAKHR